MATQTQSTDTQTQGITADQIKVLKTWDRFYLYTTDGRTATVNCTREDKIGESTYSFELPCAITGSKSRGRKSARSHLSNYKFSPSYLASTASILRPGDLVSLEWSVNSGNKWTEEAGFEWYTLELCITRGRVKLTYLLEHNTYPPSAYGMVAI